MCIKKDILAALTYFDVFSYPLKRREIYIYLRHPDKMHHFDYALNTLLKESLIFRIGEFYSLQDNYALAERRRWGNDRAIVMLRKAERSARVIASFPFVKGVAVSGSLSKKFADEKSDIDFLIITSANRLWLARTFLHLFKKSTYLFNLQHHYCMNYFVDEAEMCILERNIYTATEIATIMPIYEMEVFERFYRINSWTKQFLPNNYMHVSSGKEMPGSAVKKFLRLVLDNRMGNQLDNFLHFLTARSWNKKSRKHSKNIKGLPMSLHTGKHFAKPDPSNFQKTLLQQYENKLTAVLGGYERSLQVINGSS